eukprot:PITA_17332
MQDRGVIAYASRKLKPHEELYATHDLELAAVVLALKLWRHYLVGRSFTLKSDHQSLQYLFTQRDLNARQRRWSEFLSEYDFGISYIKGKENVVADALSRRPRIFSLIPIKVDLRQRVLDQLIKDSWYLKVRASLEGNRVKESKFEGYVLEHDGILRFHGRMYIPDDKDIRDTILREAHRAVYSAHPGVGKMYADTKKLFFWSGMKHDITQFVAKCLECQQVKADHCHPAGLLQPHDIPMSKWETISMDFITGLPLTSQRHNAILIVVDKLTKSAHFIPVRDTYDVADVARDHRLEDRVIIGPELIHEMEAQVRQIRQRLKEAQDRQKSYADAHRTDRRYEVGDQVFIRIKPNKSIIRFGKGTKLSPRFIGPFKVVERVGPVAYCLALPPHLHKIHNVFRVSVLRHYIADLSHNLQWKELQVSDEGVISIEPLRILERRVRQLRNRLVDQVKVQWDKYSPGSATWENTEDICQKYPRLCQF